jgi:hypothetical protein
VGAPSAQAPHLDLPPHILNVILLDQLLLADALAGTLLARALVYDQARDPKLPLAQDLLKGVVVAHVLGRLGQHVAVAWRRIGLAPGDATPRPCARRRPRARCASLALIIFIACF